MPLNAAQPPKKGSLPDPKDLVVPPLTVEEEDAIIHTRITNDEKALRRVIKKFHSYATLAHPPAPSAKPEDSSSATEDAREAFLVELASFELTLKKSLMVCEAEARQVEEYERERARIADEHVNLRGQIDQLKTSLEHAQMLRKRKIEYDVVAEKINALPSRAELEQTIRELESDMSTIRVEHETQQRTMQAQQAALHDVVRSVAALRQIGKDADADAMDADVEADGSPGLGGGEAGEVGESGEVQEEREDGEEREGDVSADSRSGGPSLNPGAPPFVPVGASSPSLHAQRSLGIGRPGTETPGRRASPAPQLQSSPSKRDEDIEMGEVTEDREEGEATDASSELSDVPDD